VCSSLLFTSMPFEVLIVTFIWSSNLPSMPAVGDNVIECALLYCYVSGNIFKGKDPVFYILLEKLT
jgi:hypothetical protein